VNDLLSKVATQSVLNREDLSNRDEQLKLAQLAGIAGLDQTNFSNAFNLLGASNSAYNSDYNNAANIYQMQLPYLASVTTKGDPLGGAIQGGINAAIMSGGNPWAAAAGAGYGAYSNSGSTTVPYAQAYGKGADSGTSSMDWKKFLSQLQGLQSQKVK
jgi:hypothetical protein